MTTPADVLPPPSRRIGTLKPPDCRIYYEVTGTGPAIVYVANR